MNLSSKVRAERLPAVFTEMLRSFVGLAGTLNLSKTVKELGVTRQTVVRHISQLEAIKGVKLFEIIERQYHLTDSGRAALQAAEKVLQDSEQWISDRSESSNGLNRIALEFGDKGYFRSQQHPSNHVWSDAPPIIKRGLKDWAKAEGQLEHQKLGKIRPFLLVYRQYGNDWICVEVGEKSSYATWLGWSGARCLIGRGLAGIDIYNGIDQLMVRTYSIVLNHGIHWYDHTCAKFPRQKGGNPEPVNYQRLVSPCSLPDGTPVVSVLVARTDAISIDGVKAEDIPQSKQGDLMEFEI